MKYDIFISYRRKGGYETAKHLYDLLTRDGYSVSFDIDTLRSGDFDTALLKRIEECTDFILILNKGAFDRTLDPAFNPKNDWLRNELAHALKHNKNIIPVMLDGFDSFPEDLPDDICKVVRKNGPKYDSYYFDEFYRKLKKSFFETPEPTPQERQTSAGRSSVKFKSNLCCDYYIDGEYQDRIKEDALCQIALPQGEYFFEFVSAYEAGIDKESRKIKLNGEDVAFEIDLNSIVEARENLEEKAIMIMDSRYGCHRDFHCGLCFVERNGLCGYLNSKLEEVIPFVYEEAEDFSAYYGTAAVKRYGKYGTIDLKGNVCIPFEYDKLGGENGYSAVTGGDYVMCSKGGKCGVVNQSGEVLLPIEYDAIGDIVSDHCIIVLDKKAGLYDLKDRKQVLPLQFEKVLLSERYAIFCQDGRSGLYFLDGTLTTDARYDEILPFSEDVAPVRIGKLWGFIDKADKLVISPRFDECRQFYCGVAAVRKGDKWSYIDHSGREIIAYKYDDAGSMLAGVAKVRIGDSVGLINRKAEQIYPMTKGVELRHSMEAYRHPDKAYPVLVRYPDESAELITPQGKGSKFTKEEYTNYENIIILSYDNNEHLFSDCYDEGDLNVSAKYDPEDCFFLFKADASDSDGGYADSAKSTENSPELLETIIRIIADYFEKDASEIGPDTNVRSELGADEDDMTDIMMRIEEQIGVCVDCETFFRSLDTIQEMADYVSALDAADPADLDALDVADTKDEAEEQRQSSSEKVHA